MDKKTIFLIIFGIIIFGIRLFNINEAIYDDESNFAYSLTVMDQFGFNHDYYSPQPLNFLYKPFIALFGLETWVFRIVPWLFGIINTVFVYYFARRNWDKKVAFWAAFLMLVSFYPTLASLQFDVEGNLVMFSVLLMFFSYLEYEKAAEAKDKRKQLGWQILAGIGLGIAVICKYNAVYIVLILALYSLIKRKWKIKETFKDLFMVYLVGFIFFLIYILMGVIASPDNWLKLTAILSWSVGFGKAYRPDYFSLLGVALYLLWATPLLFGFYLLSLFQEMEKKLLLFLWITVSLFFYAFVINQGSLDRYFMQTIPALAILGGFFISEIKLRRKQLFFGFFVFGFGVLFLFLSNSFPIKYVARFPELYLYELKSFNLNFLFAYTSASGPTFGVNFATIFWSFLIGFGCLFLYFIFSRKKRGISEISKWFFMGFLSVSLAFNIFLVSEYLFHSSGADVSDAKWQMINQVKEDHLPFPIYTNDQGIQWYFEPDYLWKKNSRTLAFGDNEIGSSPSVALESIKKRGGTIVLLTWPPLPKNSPAWEVIKTCSLDRQFYSQKELIGAIYLCSPENT